jgi:hypothetical protein
MTLDLDDHLTQPPDCPVTAFLRHLSRQILLSTLLIDATAFLGLVRDILRGTLPKRSSTSLCTIPNVDSRVSTALLILAGERSGISNVARAFGVRRCTSVTGRIPSSPSCRRLPRFNLALQLGGGQIWGVVPRIIISWLVNLCQLIIGWFDFGGSFDGSVASYVSHENRGIAHYRPLESEIVLNISLLLTKLSKLPISDKKRSKGAKTTQRLLAMLPCRITANWCSRPSSFTALNLLCLPDEVLEQVTLVLGQK